MVYFAWLTIRFLQWFVLWVAIELLSSCTLLVRHVIDVKGHCSFEFQSDQSIRGQRTKTVIKIQSAFPLPAEFFSIIIIIAYCVSSQGRYELIAN